MVSARIRLALLWLSQVSRVLSDWALRITAFLELREQPQYRYSAWYVVTALFIAPFIVLAPFHGSISNGLPRRWVLTGSALFCLAAVAVFVPASGPWLACMAIVAIGSALYSPTRYAVLPAASQDARLPLPSVNGWMEMGGAAAIVGGVILGLQLEGTLSAGLPQVIAAILGLNVVCLLSALPAWFPSDVRRPERPLQALGGFFRDCRRIFADTEARGSLLGLSVFQAVVTAGSGSIFMLALDNEAAGHSGAMFALIMVCLGTAAGCGLAALQVNPRRGLGLVSLGITGMLIADVWAALSNVDGIAPAFPSFLLGLTGGLINTPLRSVYLGAVPADARGNAMSVMNTAIYLLTTTVAALMFGLIHTGILPTPEHQLWFLAAVVAVGAAVAWRVLLAQTVELIIEWVVWPMYRIRAHGPGVRRIPMHGPLLLIANHSSYADPFWVAKIVPRHLTPMMTSYFYDMPVIRWLMVHVVRAIRVQDATFRREAPELQDAIRVLREGGCVLIFPEAILRRKDDLLLRQFGRGVWHILAAVPETPVVVCWIEGGWGSYASYKGGPPMTNKRLDWWRRIDIAVTEPQVLDPSILADQRTTRRYLMRACLEARGILGLPVPPDMPAPSEEEPKAG